jgi:uncharacterized phosphosugar-binding protein
MSGIEQYFEVASSQLSDVLASQLSVMEEMAELWAKAIQAKHLLYAFGSGHSRFIAGELFFRAGGLAPVMTIDDPALGKAERLEGYADSFMGRYAIEAGDLLVVISNSGINPLPIEVALHGREQGAKVIALTNYEQSKQAASRHSSGKKLYEVADIILDNKGIAGDAAVDIPSLGWKVGPTSTLVSVAMLNAVVAQTAHNLAAQGIKPPVLLSANIPEGDEHNQAIVKEYWPRLTAYPLRKISSG